VRSRSLASLGMSSTKDSSTGMVYLVGAGPGDPGLLTVRGRELLDTCDALVYDALANPDLVAEVGRRVPTHDVGKRGGSSESTKQEEINALLISLARKGKRVVRLKGGDPFVFGRGSEEAQALAAAKVPFEVVPGVTAGIAAPAYAGIPVTHRGMSTSVTLVTGHEDPSKPETQVDWAALAKMGATGTIVLYMGVKTLPSIVHALIHAGLPAAFPAAAVQWGTHAKQRTVVATLSTLVARAAAEGIAAPVITIIGRTVDLRDEIAWFETRPLFGRRIVVTRATAVGGTLADRLRALGADVLEASTTTIEPVDTTATDAAIEKLKTYDWLILTSQVGVRLFWDALRRAKLDTRALHGIRIGVIGPATAATLREHGIEADVIPRRFVAEALLESLTADASISGANVLYATAADAREVLPSGLREAGASVDVVTLYRSVPDEGVGTSLREAIDSGSVDVVTFASGSAVEGFVKLVGAERAKRSTAISIGPITTAAARSHSIEVIAEAAEATIDALVDAVAAAVPAGRAS
jgi:uroporphyrinogen III methyltransferase / synthase